MHNNKKIIMVLIVLFISINLHADIKNKMLNLYKSEKYQDACNIGFYNLNKYSKDEDFLSLYAFSCLNSDFIDRLSAPAALMKFSPEARANSAYFSVVFMQKKLLYHALVDGYDLSQLKLPTTEHILSKVFDAYVKFGKHKPKDNYIFEDENDNKTTYKLSVVRTKRLSKIIIEEYKNNIFIKKHIYW